jgi:hypothetical protein
MNEKILEMIKQFETLTKEEQRFLMSALQQTNSLCCYDRGEENDR